MARVTVEDCVDKVPNRFDLVMLAAHRAREITAGSPVTVDRDNDKNPVVALREIAEETQPVDDLRERMIESTQTQIEAIREVFADNVPPISATKSLTGHSLGAAGVHEAIYSLLMMNNGFICESANIETLDPAVADMPIVRKREDNVDINCVMSNSFGFGGTNATLVFRRFNG